MVAWHSQPELARIYLIPLGPYVARASYEAKGITLGASTLSFSMMRIVIQDFGKRIVDEIVSYLDLQDILEQLPERLSSQLQSHLDNFTNLRKPISLKGLEKPLIFERPLVMGVLNVTPDSFSDGGKFVDVDKAIAHAKKMVELGADIIDIGGESTRPGASTVWEGDEKQRVLPVIEALTKCNIPLSLDSRNGAVIEEGLDAGVHIINDVSALSYDDRSLDIVAASNAPVILMHSRGDPKNMQDAPLYDDVVLDIYDYLKDRIEICVSAGIDKTRIIVDPGIGFGKRVVKDNLAIINNLSIYHTLGCPLLIGVSRKRFVGALTGVEEAERRMAGSITAAMAGIAQGAQMIRVHDVDETVQAIKLSQGLNDAAMMDMLSY